MAYTDPMVYQNDPDPHLTAALDAGPDQSFTRGLAKAIDLIARDDIVAFWLQAVGDGTPFTGVDTDPVTTSTPHQVVHVAGYDDSHEYPTVRDLAELLLAHHIGILTDPDSHGLTVEEILEDVTTLIVSTTGEFFGPLDGDDFQYPSGPFDTQLDRANNLLDHSELTAFFLQVVVPTEGAPHLVTNDPTLVPEGLAAFENRTIEYLVAAPATIDDMTSRQLVGQYHTQHAYVAAKTADRDVAPLVEDACRMAQSWGFLYESITPA